MKLSLLIWWIVLMLIGTACSESETLVERTSMVFDTVRVDMNTAKSVTIDEGIDSLFIIALESSPEAIFGTIEKLIVSDSLIFIKDNRYSKAIFVFDMTGHFQFKISNVGAGPGEYEDIFDFDVSGEDIYVNDSGRKILQYSKIDGRFKTEYQFDSWAGWDIAITSDTPTRILFNRMFGRDGRIEKELGRCLIFSTSTQNDRYECLYDYHPIFEEESYRPSIVFARNDEEVFFSPAYTYQLYKYSNQRAKPFIYLDFGEDGFDNEQLTSIYKSNPSAFGFFQENPIIHHILQWAITDNLMCMTYSISNLSYSIFIDLNSKTVYKEGQSVMSRLVYGFTIPLPVASNGDWLVGYEEVGNLLRSRDRDTDEKRNKVLKENNIGALNPNDNPLLIFYKYDTGKLH